MSFELRDIFSSAENVFCEFIELPIHLSGHEILEAIARVVGDKEKRRLYVILL